MLSFLDITDRGFHLSLAHLNDGRWQITAKGPVGERLIGYAWITTLTHNAIIEAIDHAIEDAHQRRDRVHDFEQRKAKRKEALANPKMLLDDLEL